MASVPGVGPGAGTASVLGAKIVRTTFGAIFGLVRGIASGILAIAGLAAGGLILGFLLHMDVEDPLHPSPQPATRA